MFGMSIDFPGPARTEHGRKCTAGQQTLRETRIPRVCSPKNIEFTECEIRGCAYEGEAKVVKARSCSGSPLKDKSVDKLLKWLGTQ